MTKDEALKLALEALEEAWYHVGTFQPTEKAIDLYDEARTAIKEALAQPEQEPVCDKDPQGCWNVRCQLGNKYRNTSLQSKEPDQEPVAWITPDGEGFRIRFSPPVNDVPLFWDALYTTPSRKAGEK